MTTAVAPPAASSSRLRTLALVGGGVGLTLAVLFIYRDAARSYFFNDDFQWLQGARGFALGNVLHLERYNHFYRPVIEVYFYLGRRLFGCDPVPFHVLSIGIHLACALLVYVFARALSGSSPFGALAAVFFAVQPGHAQAVAWVGAITDLLPALWYLLAMSAHLLFLQRRNARFYAISLLAFAACLLTHESSSTLLVMMIALDVTLACECGAKLDPRSLVRRSLGYAPFALLLAGSLVITYVVNSRSYLIREGHYQVGWHAVPHALDYLITLWVGTRGRLSQGLMVVVVAALLVRGTPRVRFFTLWTIVTIAPASLFTWGNVSRYLYLPAVGFSLLMAEMILAVGRLSSGRGFKRIDGEPEPRSATHTTPVVGRTLPGRLTPFGRTVAIAVATVLAVRFATFATRVPAGFLEWTRPYQRYAEAVRRAARESGGARGVQPGAVLYLAPGDLENIPVLYRDPAAEVALCGPDVHVAVR